jgi:asparagine synthase (glutamine-hydrolysing)
MCGIASLFVVDPLAQLPQGLIGAMNATLRHRGPDGEGVFESTSAALGHRRLAIIDVTHGHQPMTNEDGSIWLAFNGEVYNHGDLRRELQARGHQFQTHSDTEVIIHGWEEFGDGLPARLEGMFAFVLYNRKTHEVFAARDRIGKKPLFYGTMGGVLHLASEMKAFFRSPYWSGDLNENSFEGYLSLGYFLAPETIYRNVHKLLPAHWLKLRNGVVSSRCYWDVTEFDTDTRREAVVLEELDSLLAHAVRERLEDEVPLGTFLSGGIDSALVASYMADALDRPVVTTTVGFADSAHNELAAAGITARAVGSHHFEHVIEPRLETMFDAIVAAFDEPFADSSAIPTYYVSQMARQHVTVALSGDGGDEAFTGYDFRYRPHAVEARLRRFVPGGFGRAALIGAAGLWPRSASLPRPLRLRTVLDNLGRDAADAYYNDLCFLKPADARRLLGRSANANPRHSPVYEAVTAPYRACPSPSAVQRAQFADLKIYLPNDVLVKVDRMSMLHGLEVRCPLLDRRVIEFAFRLPTVTKMPRLRAKHLLRELVSRRLPRDLLRLPKRGFTAPIGPWIAGPFADAWRSEVLAMNSRTRATVDGDVVERMFADHRRGAADHGYVLWALWVFERWAHQQRTTATRTLDYGVPSVLNSQ